MLLVYYIRESLGLTGTHIGCDTTSCGACTDLVEGVPKTLNLTDAEVRIAEDVPVVGGERNPGLRSDPGGPL